jgi:SAM-dependent methyltransferase
MRTIQSETDLYALEVASRTHAVIAAWSHLGLFDRLAKESALPLSDLPGDPRALAITARILAHLGLLSTDGTRWALTESARRLHADGSLTGRGLLDGLGDLSRLADVLTKGGPVTDAEGRSRGTQGGVRAHDPEGSRRFMDMLHRRSAGPARETAFWMARHLERGAKVLDLGGGHGRYARELVEAGMETTLFDIPLCVGIARERHGEALAYREGDFFADELGGPYDAIVASNIVHGFSKEDNARILDRCRAALGDGGLLVLKDMFLDPTGTGPDRAVAFGMTMLCYTEGGETYRLDEIDGWMRAAGFEPMRPVACETFILAMGRAV